MKDYKIMYLHVVYIISNSKLWIECISSFLTGSLYLSYMYVLNKVRQCYSGKRKLWAESSAHIWQ